MKKFLLSLVAASLIATPAMAQQRVERVERKDNTADIIAALIAGGLIGAAIAEKNEREDRRYDRYDRRYDDRDYYDDQVIYRPRQFSYRGQYYNCRDHMEVVYRGGRRVTYNVRSCN